MQKFIEEIIEKNPMRHVVIKGNAMRIDKKLIKPEDFKKLVETEAKKIEERNNKTRPAEFAEEVQDN